MSPPWNEDGVTAMTLKTDRCHRRPGHRRPAARPPAARRRPARRRAPRLPSAAGFRTAGSGPIVVGLGRLHRVPDPGRDLLPGADGQGHPVLDQARHRRPRDLHQGPAGQVDLDGAGVHRQPAAELRQERHGDHGGGDRGRAAQGAARRISRRSSRPRPPTRTSTWSPRSSPQRTASPRWPTWPRSSGDVVLGGPPELETRAYGPPGPRGDLRREAQGLQARTRRRR